ncbi:helix-turn-helix domain-containing protein [Aestuariivirga sp.]|uniref:helix-turn-helix domain-containing protein n=1 Tax=Aestuariivirga sp. TaxID=2650926 RepID=UPI0039E521BF
MDERVKFIARFLEGDKVARLADEFSASRKTAYKIIDRYEETGFQGLTDRSCRPYRHANQLPLQIGTLIVRLKQEKPTWGAPKIAEPLARRYPDVHRPAISTIHAVLDRRGLVKHRKGRKNKAVGTVRQALPGMAMAAALSAAPLAAILFPDTLRRLCIIRGNDTAVDGTRDSLIERANAVGIDAIVLSPTLGYFNEDLRQFGTDALRASLRGQLAPQDIARFMVQ